MEQIGNEIVLTHMEMENYSNTYGFGDTSTCYEWYEIDVPVEDRGHYRVFYKKFYKSLAEIYQRKFRMIIEKQDKLYDLLKKDFEPHRNQRYFDPKMFPSGSMVNYDYSGGLNSHGVDFIVVKATKTYLMGYSVIGDMIGECEKFATKPKQIVYCGSKSCLKNYTKN
jgi:hypothetical protein